MQCTVALNCYVAKALLKYQITAHRPCMAYIAKTRFVTLLSTKMLDTLEKIVMHAYREEFVTVQHHAHNGAMHFFYHYAATLAVVYTG